MKKLLLLLLCAPLIFSCGENDKEEETINQNRYHNDETTISKSPKIVYLKSNNKVVTGIIYDKYENGQLKFENSRKNGEANGLSRVWYENGQLRYEANYKDGKEDGLIRFWHKNGQLAGESHAENGENISARYWDEEGNEIYSGISRKLPPKPEENVEIPEIHKKNIFVVLINKNNKILAGVGSPTNIIEINRDGSISSLKDDVKNFITNNGENPNSSESPDKAVVSLQNQEGTSYKTYIQVQNELTKAYNELRNEKSNIDYGKDFNRLNNEEQKKIKDFYPMKVSEAETKAN